ncbi:hypothetical protein M422DRAFT_50705 [Sphaerobolus stellatus SS14]|uniref:Uncharacterized protein n=1 Tax=Sphaerobolus stellatus (strain SS14) TaxID=990650 RepID=A0A0C9VIF4_SPHS4|nr:hypothetical protein M422DRAFT_50705 [Sphaerobolus stellatus SS14]
MSLTWLIYLTTLSLLSVRVFSASTADWFNRLIYQVMPIAFPGSRISLHRIPPSIARILILCCVLILSVYDLRFSLTDLRRLTCRNHLRHSRTKILRWDMDRPNAKARLHSNFGFDAVWILPIVANIENERPTGKRTMDLPICPFRLTLLNFLAYPVKVLHNTTQPHFGDENNICRSPSPVRIRDMLRASLRFCSRGEAV